jgi:lipopolysaccharide transport system permease protein
MRGGIGDLWTYRELAYFLTWRDIKVRYKQTALGAVWAALQPLAFMAIFTLVFAHIAHVSSEGVPYPVFTLAALVPWTFFASALTGASMSLVNSVHLVSKVYFPRVIIPAASAASYLVDLCISVVLLLLVMPFLGAVPRPTVVLLPVFAAAALVTALAVGIWLAAINVRYRDVKYAVPFLTQIWLFASPVAYATTSLPEPFRTLAALNPMTGVIDGFRWALFGSPISAGLFAGSFGVTAALLVVGLVYFHRVERTFADVI